MQPGKADKHSANMFETMGKTHRVAGDIQKTTKYQHRSM